MRNVKIVTLFAIIFVFMFTLTACDGFNFGEVIDDVIDNIEDYEYSADGKQETITYFNNLDLDNAEGVLSYIFITDEGAIEVSIYKEKIDETTSNEMLTYDYGEGEKYAILKLGEDRYFIDYNEKIVSDEYNDILHSFPITMMIAQFGKIEFEEDNIEKWEFVEKRDQTITYSDGKQMATVEFEYISIPEDQNDEDSITMYINFNKKLPIIMRVKYEIFDAETETTSNITVFIKEIDPDGIEEDTFVLPTEEDGYTINTTQGTEE